MREQELSPELKEIVLRNLHDIYGYDHKQIALEAYQAGLAAKPATN